VNSRERVNIALNHEEPDRVPVDFGGTLVTGINVSVVYYLRQALKLDKPGTPIKIIEPYQMLGEIDFDLMESLGIDCVGLNGRKNIFNIENENWKYWDGYHNIPVLVPEKFNIKPNNNGSIFMYPEGDEFVPPSGIMPNGGYYFDVIIRQPEISDDTLKVEDNLEEFGYITDDDIDFFSKYAKRLFDNTDKAIIANFGGTSFGDIALIPAPQLKYPKGIRDVGEWYISLAKRKDFIIEIFKKQTEIALKNIAKIYKKIGNIITVVFVSGTDFGTQRSPLISIDTYRQLFKPFHQIINDWIHTNTKWKTFTHTCGAIEPLLADFIEAGFDILNPVQCSAYGMDPAELKRKYGRNIVFWGGGIDTQKTLPFGKEEEVSKEVIERIKIFGKDGGFVFNAIHNIQANTPINNVLTMFETVKKYGKYPISY